MHKHFSHPQFGSIKNRNHFRQSYMMQFHKIMYPVFARMGVKLITRNMAQGGLGTIQAGLGSRSIYGDEVDLLLWDSGTVRRYGFIDSTDIVRNTSSSETHHLTVFCF
jgi:hypothetical protein